MSPRMTARQLEATRAARQRSRQRMLEDCRLICNEPFRRRYLELLRVDTISPTVICQELRWMRKPSLATRGDRKVADVTRLRIALGLQLPGYDRRCVGERRMRDAISYDVALRLCELLAMDPVEAGL